MTQKDQEITLPRNMHEVETSELKSFFPPQMPCQTHLYFSLKYININEFYNKTHSDFHKFLTNSGIGTAL